MEKHSCASSEPKSAYHLPQDAELTNVGTVEYVTEQEVREYKNTSKRKLKKRKKDGKNIKKGTPFYPQKSKAEVQSSIGDLVLAAEMMEKVNDKTFQTLGAVNECILHDHGDYCVPDDPELLRKMVRELKNITHQQNQLLISLQEALDTKEMQCRALQERLENERWTLISDMGQQISQLEAEIRNVNCEKEIIEKKNKDLQEQLERSSGTVLYLGQQVKHNENGRNDRSFCIDSIKHDSKWVRFYTGFDSYENLTDFLSFLTADQKLCSGKIWKKSDVGPQSALSLEDQLLLVFTRLRLGLLLQDLAFRFRVSESTVSRYWLNWTDLLHARLTQAVNHSSTTMILRPTESQCNRSTMIHQLQRSFVRSSQLEKLWQQYFGILILKFRTIQQLLETHLKMKALHEAKYWGKLLAGKLFATKEYIEGLLPENCGHINKPGTPRKLEIPILYSNRYLDIFEPKRTIQYQGLTCTIMDCTDLFFEVQAKDRTKPASTHPSRNHYIRRGYAVASSNGFITFSSSLPFGIATKVMDGQTQEDMGSRVNPPLHLPAFMQNSPVQLTHQQQEMSRQVLSLLSLIDKALNFRFLKYVYPQSMESQVDRAWIICCYLACLLHDPMGLS